MRLSGRSPVYVRLSARRPVSVTTWLVPKCGSRNIWSISLCAWLTGKRQLVTSTTIKMLTTIWFTGTIAQNTYSDREICAGKTRTIPLSFWRINVQGVPNKFLCYANAHLLLFLGNRRAWSKNRQDFPRIARKTLKYGLKKTQLSIPRPSFKFSRLPWASFRCTVRHYCTSTWYEYEFIPSKNWPRGMWHAPKRFAWKIFWETIVLRWCGSMALGQNNVGY